MSETRKKFNKTEKKPVRSGACRNVHSMNSKSGTLKEKKTEMEGMASRRLALQVIREVTEQGAWASLALNSHLTACGLNDADRRLVSRLVYDTLDEMNYLDYCISFVMAKPDTDIRLRNILRLAACQILLEDRIPESAATNTAVQLCVELGLEGLKGVCNGILRNLVRKKDAGELFLPADDPDQYASIRYTVPLWMVKRLRTDYGVEAEKLMAYRNREAAVTIRPNLTKTENLEETLSRKVWTKEQGLLPGTMRISGVADLGKDSDFLSGMFSIQSESSMMACLAMDVKPGMKVLDCCAAPGGKTCYLAEMMANTGRVQAWDIHDHRVKLIEAQAKRLGLENIRPMTRDASVFREDLVSSMDAVLLDAPCSGLGAMAEKPDIKSRVSEESVLELIELQRKLLDTVCAYVKPGGTLVYATCSILKDENERQAEAFLERHPEFEAISLPKTIPECFSMHAEAGLQLLPYRDGVEGFYLCRMRKKK